MGDLYRVSLLEQGIRSHTKAMVLGGDLAFAADQVFHGVIDTAVPMMHFKCRYMKGKCQDLVAKADPEKRFPGLKDGTGGFDGIFHGSGVTGAIGQKITVGFPGQYFFSRGFSGKDMQVTIPVDQVEQDVSFSPEIQDRYLICRGGISKKIFFFGADPAGQFEAVHIGGLVQDFLQTTQVENFGRNDGIHGPFAPDMPDQFTGIHLVDPDQFLTDEIVLY